MKLQLDGQHLRVRIDEDELGRLLAGQAVEAATRFADAFAVHCIVELADQAQATLTGSAERWHIRIPAQAAKEHAARLPTREGLRFELRGASEDNTLVLLFDVDVRDSARRLKASRSGLKAGRPVA